MNRPNETRAARRPSQGFTLIEIMAVVVIMGMLMATLTVVVAGRIESAEIQTAKNQIVRIEQALEFYRLDNARFPTSEQGLVALAEPPSSPPEPRAYQPGGYIKNRESLNDPWGQPFRYRIPGQNNAHSFDIWSLGPDGQEGSEDDIANWSDGS
ncbi:MAG: type II secretion system major pseudopilin GspG [bacterium]